MKVNPAAPPLRATQTQQADGKSTPRAPAPDQTNKGWAPANRPTSRATPTSRAQSPGFANAGAAPATGGRAIGFLSDDKLRSALPAQKLQMMKSLISDLQQAQSLEPSEAENMRGAVTQLVLGSKTPAELDFVLSRVGDDEVTRNLSGPGRMQALQHLETLHAPTPGDWTGYKQYLEDVTGAKPAGTNSLEFLVDGAEVSPRGLEILNGAKQSINLAVFQLEGDEVGGKVVDVLCAKAKAGVKVRVLLDELGSTSDSKEKVVEYVDRLKAAGAQVIINPTPLLQGDLDHRKVLVIDGQQAFTGGMNIGNHYQREWHDQQTLVQGPAVEHLQDAFFAHWTREGGALPADSEKAKYYQPVAEVPGGSETYVVTHEGDKQDRNIKAAYLKAFGTAEKSITLANPYFADADVIKALAAAAKRGVKVQVIVPAENDMAIVKRAAQANYPDLINAGVEVYEYQGRMAHQKVAVVDGKWATVGSSNLDARSLEYNDEMNLVVLDEKFAGDVQRKMFDVDLPQSKRITESDPDLRSRIDRLISPFI